jgi:hypothetical protein|tara:strand:- start:127 stop:354 length:228 start_codon:yes stop_codon:yes gene_type:complete
MNFRFKFLQQQVKLHRRREMSEDDKKERGKERREEDRRNKTRRRDTNTVKVMSEFDKLIKNIGSPFIGYRENIDE